MLPIAAGKPRPVRDGVFAQVREGVRGPGAAAEMPWGVHAAVAGADSPRGGCGACGNGALRVVCALPAVFPVAVLKHAAEADFGDFVGEMPESTQHPGQAVMIRRWVTSTLTAAGCPGPEPLPGVDRNRLERSDRVLPGGVHADVEVLGHKGAPVKRCRRVRRSDGPRRLAARSRLPWAGLALCHVRVRHPRRAPGWPRSGRR